MAAILVALVKERICAGRRAQKKAKKNGARKTGKQAGLSGQTCLDNVSQSWACSSTSHGGIGSENARADEGRSLSRAARWATQSLI